MDLPRKERKRSGSATSSASASLAELSRTGFVLALASTEERFREVAGVRSSRQSVSETTVTPRVEEVAEIEWRVRARSRWCNQVVAQSQSQRVGVRGAKLKLNTLGFGTGVSSV